MVTVRHARHGIPLYFLVDFEPVRWRGGGPLRPRYGPVTARYAFALTSLAFSGRGAARLPGRADGRAGVLGRDQASLEAGSAVRTLEDHRPLGEGRKDVPPWRDHVGTFSATPARSRRRA